MRVETRVLVSLAVGALLTARADAVAGAAETDAGATQSPGLVQEFLGLELTPVSMALGTPPCCGHPSPARLQAGLGGSVRLFRHRWELGYIIPAQASVFVSSGAKTIFGVVQVEGGVVVPGTNRRLEIGMAFGLGILAMTYDTGCDGDCHLGGNGVLFSPVARYLFVDRPTYTVGTAVRAIIPLSETSEDIQGSGEALVASVEIGFGRGPR